MQIRLQDALHIRGVFFFRHAVDAEAARKIAADLPLHREVHIARDGHIAPRDTGGGQLQLKQLAVVRALHPAGEDLAQPGRHAPVDEIGRRRQRIRRDIQVAQRLGALCDVELQPRLHGIQQKRRLIRREHFLRAGKLRAEHDLRQAQQQRLLIFKRGEERCRRHSGLAGDLCRRRALVALLEEERHPRIDHLLFACNSSGLQPMTRHGTRSFQLNI